MNGVATSPAAQRAELFNETAARRGLTVQIIEKDFWVCWTLWQLFSAQGLPAKLIFKGGTSLSKVFRAVERFSEDIDLSFDRADLGFSGSNDPALARSNKKRRHELDELR